MLKRKLIISLIAGSVAMLPFSAAWAQDYEYEFDEEWYDPTDWFDDVGGPGLDGNVVDSYDTDYFEGDFWTEDDYAYDYGYAYGEEFDLDGIDGYYQWDPVVEVWAFVEPTKEASEAAATASQQSQPDQSQAMQVAENVTTVQGTVSKIAQVGLEGSSDQHTFIQLDSAQGKSLLVDVGPNADLSTMQLEQGKQIQVRGPRAEFGGGQFVLVAQQISQAPQSQQGQYGARNSNSPDQNQSKDQNSAQSKEQNQHKGESSKDHMQNPQNGQSSESQNQNP